MSGRMRLANYNAHSYAKINGRVSRLRQVVVADIAPFKFRRRRDLRRRGEGQGGRQARGGEAEKQSGEARGRQEVVR